MEYIYTPITCNNLFTNRMKWYIFHNWWLCAALYFCRSLCWEDAICSCEMYDSFISSNTPSLLCCPDPWLPITRTIGWERYRRIRGVHRMVKGSWLSYYGQFWRDDAWCQGMLLQIWTLIFQFNVRLHLFNYFKAMLNIRNQANKSV